MSVAQLIYDWINERIGDAESVFLIVVCALLGLTLIYLGAYLAPVVAGLIFAFTLHGLVDRLANLRVPRVVAIAIVVLLFLGAVVALLVGILPLVWSQLQEAVKGIPNVVSNINQLLTDLSENYPEVIAPGFVDAVITSSREELTELGGLLLQTGVAQLPNLLAFFLFLVLTPITLFFFLKDNQQLLEWILSLAPRERPRLNQLGTEMTRKITAYVRGKVIEILIVGIATYLAFLLLGLEYAALLGLLVGLSVLIPFIGAALVTIPVVGVASIQFGWSSEFFYVLLAYTVIQAIDGNVVVPLLFSEAVDLHPVTIIVAVLGFGGLWGIWGVFFAIPLATFIKVTYESWRAAEPAIEG